MMEKTHMPFELWGLPFLLWISKPPKTNMDTKNGDI